VSKIKVILLCSGILIVGVSLRVIKGPATTPYIFEPIKYFPKMPVAENNPVTLEGIELGRMLFYDPILSKDSSISCSTCHQQANAFSDRGHAFSEGLNGDLTSRNTLPLFNLAWFDSFFWDGRASSIENQVIHPIHDSKEMNMDWETVVLRLNRSQFYPAYFYAAFGELPIDGDLISKAIGQFERTLISTNSKFDRVLKGEVFLSKDEYAGYGLVNDQTRGNCLHCHTTDGNGLGTTGKFSNNGLDNATTIFDFKDVGKGEMTKIESDYGRFRIPSLRNLAFTSPYMHDGRFETLSEVIDFYSEGIQLSPTIDTKIAFSDHGGSHLTTLEKSQIMSFLLTLNDSVFISNPAFSNPFPLDK